MTRRVAILLVLGGLLVACGSATPGAPQPSATPVTIQVGVVGSLSDASLFIANDRGYFREQGIAIEFQPFQSAANMIPLLGTGKLDVGAGAPSAGLFNAMARDVPLKIVADKGNLSPGHGYEAMIVRKDLWDKGAIRSPSDLRGHSIAIASRGIVPEVTLDTFLRTGGLTVNDVKIVPLAFPDMVTALANGAVDVANPIEPFATQAVARGVGVIWHRTNEIAPNKQVGVILYAPDFARKTDLARGFMLAYIRAARDYNDAFIKNQSGKRAELVQILARNTPVKDLSLYDKMVMPGMDPNGKVNVSSLSTDQDWFLQYGGQKQQVDLKKAIDTSFADWAVQKLGAYR